MAALAERGARTSCATAALQGESHAGGERPLHRGEPPHGAGEIRAVSHAHHRWESSHGAVLR